MCNWTDFAADGVSYTHRSRYARERAGERARTHARAPVFRVKCETSDLIYGFTGTSSISMPFSLAPSLSLFFFFFRSSRFLNDRNAFRTIVIRGGSILRRCRSVKSVPREEKSPPGLIIQLIKN